LHAGMNVTKLETNDVASFRSSSYEVKRLKSQTQHFNVMKTWSNDLAYFATDLMIKEKVKNIKFISFSNSTCWF
jgi:hypothetical protein